MFRVCWLWFGLLARCFRSHRTLLLENLALRQQLTVLKRRHPKPGTVPADHGLRGDEDERTFPSGRPSSKACDLTGILRNRMLQAGSVPAEAEPPGQTVLGLRSAILRLSSGVFTGGWNWTSLRGTKRRRVGLGRVPRVHKRGTGQHSCDPLLAFRKCGRGC
jgi:hypothetical protein